MKIVNIMLLGLFVWLFGAGLDPVQYMILLGSKYDPNMNRELRVHFVVGKCFMVGVVYVFGDVLRGIQGLGKPTLTKEIEQFKTQCKDK